MTDNSCVENTSFNSNKLISSIVNSHWSKAFCDDVTGPIPMIFEETLPTAWNVFHFWLQSIFVNFVIQHQKNVGFTAFSSTRVQCSERPVFFNNYTKFRQLFFLPFTSFTIIYYSSSDGTLLKNNLIDVPISED